MGLDLEKRTRAKSWPTMTVARANCLGVIKVFKVGWTPRPFSVNKILGTTNCWRIDLAQKFVLVTVWLFNYIVTSSLHLHCKPDLVN